jgi:hypothetical protein
MHCKQEQEQQQIPFGDDNKKATATEQQKQIPPLRCGMTTKKAGSNNDRATKRH